MRLLLKAAMVATLFASAPVPAKQPVFVESKAVTDKPALLRDPALGYVLLRTDVATPVLLMRLASETDQKVYAVMRQEAFDKARKRYPSDLAHYTSSLQTYETLKKSGSNAKAPVKPVEPTEENFLFTPFALLATAEIGPFNRFAKAEGASVYLQSITPGEYRIYGLQSRYLAGGRCLCMGSVRFTVHAGEVTDLGLLKTDGGSSMPILGPVPDGAVDPRLKDWAVRPAEYRPVGKLPNYFGVALGRLAPMEKIFAYVRDQVQDLSDLAAGPVPNGDPASRP